MRILLSIVVFTIFAVTAIAQESIYIDDHIYDESGQGRSGQIVFESHGSIIFAAVGRDGHYRVSLKPGHYVVSLIGVDDSHWGLGLITIPEGATSHKLHDYFPVPSETGPCEGRLKIALALAKQFLPDPERRDIGRDERMMFFLDYNPIQRAERDVEEATNRLTRLKKEAADLAEIRLTIAECVEKQ